MVKESRKESYLKGYKDAEQQLAEDNCLKQYIDGYKAGYRDGYQAVLEQLKLLTPEIQEKMIESGAQLGYPRLW